MCGEFGGQVARRVVGADHFASIGVIDLQLSAEQIVFISRLMLVGVGNGHDLSYGIVLVFHPNIASAGMLDSLSLPSLFVGVALGIPAQGIGNLGFEHRLAVVIDNGVSRAGGGSVGQFYLRLTVVRVVSRRGLRIACRGIILCDIRKVFGNGIVRRDVTPKGIKYGTSTDNRDLG